jgi:hypothetical protein
MRYQDNCYPYGGKTIKFSFARNELNNWKAKITERLAELYMAQSLMPKLKIEDGWDLVICLTSPWFTTSKDEELMPWLSYQKQTFFVSNNLIPTTKLLRDFKDITRTLSNVPDGFLFKLKKTGESKILRDVKEMRLNFAGDFRIGSGYHNPQELMEKGYVLQDESDFTSDAYRKMMYQSFPVVEGEIEIVEVKSGTARLASNQVKSYTDVLRKGYPLRYLHVEIISFEKNQFEIKEKLITSPRELKTLGLA